MRHFTWLFLTLCFTATALADTDGARILPPDKKPADSRLGKVRTLNDIDFYFKPPASRAEWEARRQAVREQILVATGLWPLPERTPLHPTIHGRIDRDGYTVEKVFFASLPGHYVTGNLYRPKSDKPAPGPLPGILCPHGHWAKGRFFEETEKKAQQQVEGKGETTLAGARYPLQARCAQLARMGCVVFHYDMVGYADSQAVSHNAFNDVEAELWGQNLMGLQTWNSIRALDFLLSLPGVDPKRIGVTGASGGGTQTFILGAIDDRPAVAFPAVMVSSRMQGGCVCENCSHLRVGTGNVEFAALFAPKPLGMTGANDWTLHIEKEGYPELQALYQLYDARDRVLAKTFAEFGHNYNQVSREVMYNWFNKHLALGLPTPVREAPFEPIPPKELSVFDDKHPLPKDSVDVARLRQYLTATAEKQRDTWIPSDAAARERFQKIVGAALRVMIHDQLPTPAQVEVTPVANSARGGLTRQTFFLGRKGQKEQIPALLLRPGEFDGSVVVWIDPAGKSSLLREGQPTPTVQKLLEGKAAVLAIDAFGTGELVPDKPMVPDPRFAGYTFGYNRTLLAQRVHDILTAVAAAQGMEGTKKVHLAGFGSAGPWVLLARGLCGKEVARTAADVNHFRFDKVRRSDDEMMLPGAFRYGGLPAFTALSAPAPVLLWNRQGTGMGTWTTPAWKTAGAADNLTSHSDGLEGEKVVAWLLTK
jgi:dienelactone hydrolase